MKLYTYYRSSAAYRVRIALNLKKIECEYIYIDLKNGAQREADYREINPQALVPALDTGSGIITQSLSIINYLESEYPEPNLYGSNAMETARIQSAAQVIACDIHPLDNQRVLQYLKNTLQQDPDTVDTWYRHWITRGFTALEQMLQPGAGDTPCCFGTRPSLADVCLAPQMYNARRFNTDLSAFPALCRIDAYLMTLPAFAGAAPENQPDAGGGT